MVLSLGVGAGAGSKPSTPVGGKWMSMGMGLGLGLGLGGRGAPAKSMKDLEQEKVQTGIWGVSVQKAQQQQQAVQVCLGHLGLLGGWWLPTGQSLTFVYAGVD